MKVGVHLGFSAPEAGGAFTLQYSVSQTLAQLAQESRHTFVVIGGPKLLMSPAENIRTVPVFQPTFAKGMFSRLNRTVFRLKNAISYGDDAVTYRYGEVKRILKSELDLMWYVGPFCYSMDIPYIYTLLDLQHLLQPYFPEVSADGVWQARERHFARGF